LKLSSEPNFFLISVRNTSSSTRTIVGRSMFLLDLKSEKVSTKLIILL
jgi:hypothetical protein